MTGARAWLRANPDIVAVAVVAAVLSTGVGQASPRLRLMFASDAGERRMEERAERLYKRLESQMKRFEERFAQAARQGERLRVETGLDEAVE